MLQSIAVSLYDQAAQVRWILHAACAATFTLAMTLLAVRLRRPVMRTIATIWWWQLLIALNLVVYFYWREWFVEHTLVRFLGTFALHLPSFAMAPLLRRLRATLERGEEAAARDSEHLGRWAAVAVTTTILFEAARTSWPESASGLTFIVSRVVAVFPYLYALWPHERPVASVSAAPAIQESPLAANAFRLALAIRAVVIGIDLVVRLVPWDPAAVDLLTVFVVTINLVGLVAFGTILLFVALENERAATMKQADALHAAELRDARSQRMQSLGRLASGVAHDFNNVLTVVVNAADEAGRLTAPGTPIREELAAIDAAGRQGMALTRQLLDYARQRPAAQQLFAPADVVRGMAPICERLLAAPGRIQWEVRATSNVRMDPSQFEQLVMNLVANARDAMESAPGTVTVTLTDAEVTEVAQASAQLAPGAYVKLAVADTGSGIPPEMLQSIFDPFFTTKAARGGTGLGLATVQDIARAHGGDAFVESAVGVGTTVTVWVAAMTATAPSDDPATP